MTIHHHVTCQISTVTTTGSVPLFTNMNWTWSMIPGYRFRMFCQPRGWHACVVTKTHLSTFYQSSMSLWGEPDLTREIFSVSFLWFISRSWQCLRLHGVECLNNWWIMNWNGIERKLAWHNLESTESLSEGICCPSWDSKRAPPSYKSIALLSHHLTRWHSCYLDL
jgi:hypothetical protein